MSSEGGRNRRKMAANKGIFVGQMSKIGENRKAKGNVKKNKINKCRDRTGSKQIGTSFCGRIGR